MLAVLEVDDIWQTDGEADAAAVFGTINPEHPGVANLLDRTACYVGGRGDGSAAGHPLR